MKINVACLTVAITTFSWLTSNVIAEFNVFDSSEEQLKHVMKSNTFFNEPFCYLYSG